MPKLAEPPAATAAAPAPAKGLKKVNLGGIAVAKPDKGKTVYPALPDPDGEAALLVADILQESDELDALEASLALKKAELSGRAMQFYFEHLHGKHDIPSSIEARHGDRSVLVSFQNRYKQITDEAPVLELLGDERTAQFFRQSFELNIDGDLIPEDKTEAIITALQELFMEHNAASALSAKSVIKPTKDFHTARHSALTVAENLSLQKLVPIVASVKTKGRGKAE